VTVAVTGWGWRTPLGASVGEAVSRLLAGERAARPSARFDTSSYRCRLGADVAGEPAPSRHHRFVRRMGLWGMEVAREAFARSGCSAGDRLGLFTGVGGLRAHWDEVMPALEGQEPDARDAWARGFRLLHPFWMLRYLSNNAHALLAAELGARGEGVTFGGATSAERALEAGVVDAAVVVAYDSLLEPETLVELGERGAATCADLPELRAPYDEAACGFVPGEAAAALVLERSSEAQGRALAWIDAASGADGEAGEPAAETIGLVAARVTRGERIVDGAGRARPPLDTAERAAIARVLGFDARLLCTSSAMGQLGAASSLVQVVALAECLGRRVLPPIAGLERAPPGHLKPVVERCHTGELAALAIATGAPGVVGVVRVEVPSRSP